MKPKRLAWPACLQLLWQTGQNIILVVIVAFLLLSKLHLSDKAMQFSLIGLVILVVVLLLLAVVRYWRFKYVVASDGVTIQQGIFVRQVTHIPYAKIQTIQRKQWFYLQPFHLESLTIETAGKTDKKGEGQLLAVPQSVGTLIEHYRHGELLDAGLAETNVVDQPSEALGYQINARDLNAYAISSLGIVPVILVLGWVYDKGHKLLPQRDLSAVEHQLVAMRGTILIGLVVVILLLGILVSYLNVLQRYYRFMLRREDRLLTMTRGYFQRNEVNVHVDRIQAVRFKQNVLRQWLHLSTVQALTAGQAGEDEDDDTLVILPVVKTAAAYKVLAPFIDWLPTHVPKLTHVAVKQRWHFSRNSGLLWLAALALITGLIQWWVPQFTTRFLLSWPVWLIIAFAQGRYASRNTAVAVMTPELLVLQTGSVFTREQVVVPRVKIQSVESAQTVWMKKAHLAHLSVQLRSGNHGKAIEVRYLDAEVVQRIQTWYLPSEN